VTDSWSAVDCSWNVVRQSGKLKLASAAAACSVVADNDFHTRRLNCVTSLDRNVAAAETTSRGPPRSE